MGHRELIEALRREGEERLGAIRRSTEAEEARLVADGEERLAQLSDAYARRREAATAAEENLLIGEAQRRETVISLEAKRILAGRLYGVARACLRELGGECRETLFAALAAELFPCRWETVRVNPADAELAQARFPEARIETDCDLAGGLEAAADGGRVRIDNTLEKRLERLWPEILPPLVTALDQEP